MEAPPPTEHVNARVGVRQVRIGAGHAVSDQSTDESIRVYLVNIPPTEQPSPVAEGCSVEPSVLHLQLESTNRKSSKTGNSLQTRATPPPMDYISQECLASAPMRDPMVDPLIAIQEPRSFANKLSRTSPQGRPACGLSLYAFNRSSRILLCSCGTGTISGSWAIRSHSCSTNAIPHFLERYRTQAGFAALCSWQRLKYLTNVVYHFALGAGVKAIRRTH